MKRKKGIEILTATQQAETRKQALGSVQLAMLDRVDSLVWEYWGVESGDDNAMKEKQIKKVARAVEHGRCLCSRLGELCVPICGTLSAQCREITREE